MQTHNLLHDLIPPAELIRDEVLNFDNISPLDHLLDFVSLDLVVDSLVNNRVNIEYLVEVTVEVTVLVDLVCLDG